MENYFRMSHTTGTRGNTGILTQLLTKYAQQINHSNLRTLLPVEEKGVNCLSRNLTELQWQLAPEDATAYGSRLVGLPIETVRQKTAHRVVKIDLVLSLKLTGTVQLLFPFTE
jgi:hypothetical protein